MNLLISIRFVSIVLFIIFSTVILSVAAWNVSVINHKDTFRVSMDIFLIAVSAIALLFIIPATVLDISRSNAFVSKVWFEIAWLSLFWVLYLVGASALTTSAPDPICTPKNFVACTSAQVVLAFLWLMVATLVVYLFILILCAIFYSKNHPNVWFANVREFRWFEGGGTASTVTPLPHSPVSMGFKPKRFSLRPAPVAPLHPHPHQDAQPIEQIAAEHGMTTSEWIRHQALQNDRQLAGVPEISTFPMMMAQVPSHRPVHYTAVTSTRIDGRAQQPRQLSRDLNEQPAMGLYPAAMNKVFDAPRHIRNTSQDATIPAPPQLSNALGLQTQPAAHLTSQRSTREPPPIRDWPRANPPEPHRRDLSRTVAPPYAPPTAGPVATRTHRVADHSSPPERVARRSTSHDGRPANAEPSQRPAGPRPLRPQRHRPPPLDLSRALPGRC